MSTISPDNPNYFKSASYIFSKVKRDLSSFDAANLIDDGEFPEYVKHVLKIIGLGVYKESDAVVAVKNYKALVPKDFSMLYSAYKCTPYVEGKDFIAQQGAPISVYNDVTWELLCADNNCDIECLNNSEKVFERITVKQFVKGVPITVNFKNPILLRLSPNVKREFCAEDCMNLFATSLHEITINDRTIYTNFTNDSIYLKYYAFPKDEDGIPMIPDLEYVERAIEWHIKCELLKNMWYNNSVPDLQNRWQAAEMEAAYWLDVARKERKMPSFDQMVNNIRRNRSINKIAIFAR